MLIVLQRSLASKQLMGQLPTFQQHEYYRKGHFGIVVWIVQDHFMSKKDPLEQRSGEMRYFNFYLSSCQRSSSWIGQQFDVRFLYCCPSKVYSTKGEMLKFVFCLWDDICRSSSWTSRTQETFSFGRASVKSSGICLFTNIYMGLYSSTLATLRRTFGGWGALYEVSPLPSKNKALSWRKLNCVWMIQMTSLILVQGISWLVPLLQVFLSLICPVSCLSMLQHLQRGQQLFWKRWSTDYLNSQQQTGKWASTQLNLHPGAVVLVKDSNLPPQDWTMAAVKVLPRHDGLVRVATVMI